MPPIISIYSCAFAWTLLFFPKHPIHMYASTWTCKYLYLNSYGRSSQLIHIFFHCHACFFVYLFDVCRGVWRLQRNCGTPSVCMMYIYVIYCTLLSNTIRLLEYLLCVYSVPSACVCAPQRFEFRRFRDISLLYIDDMSS